MTSLKIRLSFARFLIIVLIVALLPSSVTLAADEETCSIKDTNDNDICLDYFYSNNDILYYNPNATNCTVDANTQDLSGDKSVEKILRYFTGKGLTLAAAAGFAGNMKQESGFNPKIIQGGGNAPDNYRPKSGTGFGLVQWTSGGRQKALYLFAKSQNKNITDLGLQLDFVWKELNTGYKKSTLNKVRSVGDPVRAAIIVHDNYEISADSTSTVRNVRGGNAKKYYNSFKGKIVEQATTFTDDTTTENGCQSQNEGGLGVAGGFTFPLKTTKAVIKKGADGAKWCAEKTTNCHHSAPAADIFAPTGTPIVAVKAGTVVSANPSSGSCYSRAVGCNLTFMGDDGVLYYYAHMNKHALVKPGQKITAGQLVGHVGDKRSAMNTPRHLHIDALPGNKYKYRPACTYAACKSFPFINVQKPLHDAYEKLPN